MASYESCRIIIYSNSTSSSHTFEVLVDHHFDLDDFVPLALDVDHRGEDGHARIVVAGSQDFILSLQVENKTCKLLAVRQIPTKGVSCLQVRKEDWKILIAGNNLDSVFRFIATLSIKLLEVKGTSIKQIKSYHHRKRR